MRSVFATRIFGNALTNHAGAMDRWKKFMLERSGNTLSISAA